MIRMRWIGEDALARMERVSAFWRRRLVSACGRAR
jgi:hypothetical protein